MMSNLKNKIYVDVHVIQSLPPSCINRDDTGSPKTAIYGGVRRARVSSQSWKHAMREMFKEHFNEQDLGERTKKIVEKVADQIYSLRSISKEDAMELAEKIINRAGVNTTNQEAKALFFMSSKQAENLAQLALTDPLPGKKDVQAIWPKEQDLRTLYSAPKDWAASSIIARPCARATASIAL